MYSVHAWRVRERTQVFDDYNQASQAVSVYKRNVLRRRSTEPFLL